MDHLGGMWRRRAELSTEDKIEALIIRSKNLEENDLTYFWIFSASKFSKLLYPLWKLLKLMKDKEYVTDIPWNIN